MGRKRLRKASIHHQVLQVLACLHAHQQLFGLLALKAVTTHARYLFCRLELVAHFTNNKVPEVLYAPVANAHPMQLHVTHLQQLRLAKHIFIFADTIHPATVVEDNAEYAEFASCKEEVFHKFGPMQPPLAATAVRSVHTHATLRHGTVHRHLSPHPSTWTGSSPGKNTHAVLMNVPMFVM